MNSIYRFVLVFFAIFGWRIIGFIEIPHLISLILLLVHQKISKDALSLLLLFVPAFIYVQVAGVYALMNYDVYSTETLFRIVRIALMIVGLDILSTCYIHTSKELYNFIFSALIIHALLIIGMFLNSSFREIIYTTTGAYSIVNDVYPFVAGLRISGLTYGLAITAVLQSYLIVFVLYNYLEFNIVVRFIVFVLSLATIALTGRSGFLVVVFYVLYFALSRKLAARRYVLFLFGAAVVFVVRSLSISFSIDGIEWLISSNSEVLELFDKGNSRTSESLLDMYFLPSGLHLLFGYGTSSRFIFNEYLNIDPGFVRWIWSYGIFGSTLLYFPFIKIIYDVIKLRNPLILMILSSLFLMHFKEDVLYVRVNFYLILIMYFVQRKLSMQSPRQYENSIVVK